MHQRSWLSLLTLPLVAAFTYPVMFQPTQDAPRMNLQAPAQDPLAGLSDIQDVLTLVRDNYVDKPDMEKVISGGIQGVLERAHPLNSYLTPEDLHRPDPGPAGIGITVVKRQIYAQVVAVVPDSPAAKAGFQVSDMVRKLDGDSIGPMSAWTLERRLRGQPGSDLTLLRYAAANGDLKQVTVKRALVQPPPIAVRKDPQATVLALADLTPGRAAQLTALLPGLDHKLPLVLDLRQCAGGGLHEAALVAGLFVGSGPLATVQETGKPPVKVAVVPASLPPFAKLAVLQGNYTLGPAEALSSALKKQSVPVFGERSYGYGVERTRFLLRQGGAAEVVNKRWLGAGGEYLGAGGEKPDAMKPQDAVKGKTPTAPAELQGFGVLPDHIIKAVRPDDHAIKGVKPEDDPLPKILEILGAKATAKTAA
ncbi:MAG: S41 family peptidase [Holophaga sp.]|nr:S41 family peptidase [Holophaga sp.]